MHPDLLKWTRKDSPDIRHETTDQMPLRTARDIAVLVLKTVGSDCAAVRPGATLGATRMNNLLAIRTRLDNRQRRARGHELV